MSSSTSSLSSTALVLLAASAILFQQTSGELAPSNFPTWSNGSSEVSGDRTRRKANQPEVTCDEYASCASDVDHAHTCFCDRLCRLYSDCCPDYVDEAGGRPLGAPLPPQFFACSLMSVVPFYVITECPVTYTVQFVRDACQRGSVSERPPSSETFYVVPVSSRTSGLVYRNIYCAACYGDDDVGFWNVMTTRCREPEGTTGTGSGLEDIDDLMRRNSFVADCSFLYLPPSDVPTPRRCVSSIDTCPDGTELPLASRCTYSSVAYVYFDAQARTLTWLHSVASIPSNLKLKSSATSSPFWVQAPPHF